MTLNYNNSDAIFNAFSTMMMHIQQKKVRLMLELKLTQLNFGVWLKIKLATIFVCEIPWYVVYSVMLLPVTIYTI